MPNRPVKPVANPQNTTMADSCNQSNQYFNLLGVTPKRLRIWKGSRGRSLSIGDPVPEGWNVGYPVNGWQKDKCQVLVHESDGPEDLETKAKVWEAIGLEPSFQIFSGSKSIHSYWLLETPVTQDEWQVLQKRLYLSLGGDSSLQDLGQVMRVPGYPHPATGDLCRFWGEPTGTSYAGGLIGACLIEVTRPKATAARDLAPPDLVALDAIQYLGRAWGPYQEGQGTYPERLRVAQYLNDVTGGLEAWVKAFGDEGCGRPDAASFFESLGSGSEEPTTVATVFYEARRAGWQHPVTFVQSLEDAKSLSLCSAKTEEIEIAAERLPGNLKKNLVGLKTLRTKERIAKAPEGSVLEICRPSEKGEMSMPVDLDTARFLAEKWKDRFRWSRETKDLYQWTGTHWEAADDYDLRVAVSEALEPVKVSINYLAQVTSWLRTACPNILEPATGGIGFRNGYLVDGELKPNHPDNLNRASLPFDYLPEATCPKIQEWLNWCQSGPRAQRVLVALLRCALVGRPSKAQIFGEITGVSRSGKSTFISLAQALAGPGSVHSTDPHALEKERFGLLPVVGKNLVLLQDIGKYGGEVNRLKALTGGDRLSAEVKHQKDQISFVFKGLILIAGEHTLKTSDYQSGMDRRRVQIHFSNRVEGPTRDLIEVFDGQVTGEFAPELPGLVNLVLGMSEQECIDLLTDRESLKDEDPEFHREQLADQNPIAGFAMEFYEPDPESEMQMGNNDSLKGIYSDYKAYCQQQAIEPVKLTRFGRDFRDTVEVILGWKLGKFKNGKGLVTYKGLKRQQQP
jgi:phage/plasmid-associated DNA primase